MVSYTFQKEEKLCSQKVIGEIFLSGSSFLCYPFKVVWKFESLPSTSPIQVMFSVPKRLFKRAHDRNLLKRRMREVYRMKKHQLYELTVNSQQQMALIMVYIAKEELEFSQLNEAMDKIIIRFQKNPELQNKNET